MLKRLWRHLFAAYESVDQFLIRTISRLNDDIYAGGGKSRIPNKGKSEGTQLRGHWVMLTKADDVVRLERIENRADRLQRRRASRYASLCCCSKGRHGNEEDHTEDMHPLPADGSTLTRIASLQ